MIERKRIGESTTMSESTIDRLLERTRTIGDLQSASALLGWDQETYMPDGAAAARSEQVATIDAMVHDLYTNDEAGAIAEDVSEGNEDWHGDLIREFRRKRDRATRVPVSFVRELSKATSIGQHSWRKARQAADFSHFAEDLRRIVDLKRKHASYLGDHDNPYDALLDIYEPGMTADTLRPVFERLKQGTTDLLAKIDASENRPDDGILYTDFDKERQLAVSREIIEALGFDFNRGRVDLSAHPFCTSFAISDVRLTTRVYTDDLRSCLFGLIHEAGHGMYEQGFDQRYARTLLASGASMGIHESQSLFFENVIARSRPFWSWAFPKLRDAFPDRLSGIDADEFYRIVNTIKRSFIRVEADELTYNLHIILRFEIEDDLINGRIDVDDLPEIWNTKMNDYLGIVPKNDAEGLLQDVHWSFGGHGYFPSYTLGKLYAAMFDQALRQDIDNVDEKVARGDFADVVGWMRNNIHTWGAARRPAELVTAITGTNLGPEPFLSYIGGKIEDVYG